MQTNAPAYDPRQGTPATSEASIQHDDPTITLYASPSGDVDWKSEVSKFAPIDTPSQVLDVAAFEQAVTLEGRALHGSEGAAHDNLRSVAFVEMLVEKLVTKNEKVTIRIPSRDKSAWSFQLTPFGRQFSNALLGFPHFTTQGFQFSPSIELVRTVLESYSYEQAHHGLPGLEKYPAAELETEDITPRCKAGMLSKIAFAIRQKAKSKPFRADIQHARQETQRAKKSMTTALVRALQKSKRVLVIRVDLEYRNQGGKFPSVEETAKDLARLLNNRRHNAIFDHLLEYVWKIEVGFLRGPHVHCIFLFDGNSVKNDNHYALEIGRYWAEIVTKKSGAFHACNVKKARYRDCGIGMVHVTDVDKLVVLGKIVDYLSKTTQAMRSPSVRSYGTSLAPRTPKSNIGRPSKQLPNVVERLLMGNCSRDEFVDAMREWQNNGVEVGDVC